MRFRTGTLVAQSAVVVLLVLASDSRPHDLTITAGENGQTVTVHVWQSVRIRLDPTTWRFGPPSDKSVVRQGPTAIVPGPRRCHVEFFCGTASVDAWPLRPGDATITAYRTYCGEARWCDLTQVAFRVTIHVVP